MSQDLRIFISSPGDVTPERLIAKRIIDRLAREFEHHCKIEPVLWERQPLIATGHFQESIEPPPSKTEIVVVVIWSRLGTPLPKDKFPGAITGGEVTGTEWEFEDAVNAYEQRQLPNILTYFKRAPVMASLEDDAELERQRAQKRMVEDFVQRWFEDKEAGTFKAASHPFQASAEFEDMLETHLRELINRHIDITDTDEGRVRRHKGSPFRGLEAFEVEHAPIFFGRTRARNELREVLVRQASRGCAFVMVFGSSGSGKSSLVKAGLLPDLMLPGMVENVGLCRVALMRPSDNPGDLFAALSAALLRTTDQSQKTEARQVMALPELIELEYDTTTLASQLRDASNALLPIRQGLKQALKQARKTAKLAHHAKARLAIVVDQLEELFTLDCPETDCQSFVNTLTALARSGEVWVITTMRSDFFDRLARLPELVRLSQGEGRYLLMPPNEAEIGQIIRQPAQAVGLRFETREDGIPLDEKLREVAGKDPSALPLLEFTLEQLWRQRSDKRKLTYEAYERLGGMEGALGRRAKEVLKAQPEEVRQALPKVLRALVTVSQEEHAAATARTALLDSFPEGTPQRQLVDAFLHPTARLLIADEGGQVRITHEALLSHWTQATNYIRKNRQDLQTRTRVDAAVVNWEQGNKDKAFLLAEGKPLADAEDLLVGYNDELDVQTIEFIKASSARAKRKKRRLVAFAFGASVLAIVAATSAFWAWQQKNLAKERAITAEATLRWSPFDLKSNLSDREVEGLLTLARDHKEVKRAFAKHLKEDAALAERFSRSPKAITRALAGLDTDARAWLIEELLVTPMAANSAVRTALGLLAAELEAGEGFHQLVAAIQDSTNSDQLGTLGKALVALAPKLTPAQAEPAVDRLVAAIKEPTNSDQLEALGKALAALAPKLTPAQAEPAVDGLVAAIKEPKFYHIWALGKALVALAAKLTSTQAEPAVDRLVAAIKDSTKRDQVRALGEALVALAAKLTSTQAEPAVDRLVAAIKDSTKRDQVRALGEALAALPVELTPAQAEPAVDGLVAAIQDSTSRDQVQALGKALVALAAKLTPAQAEPAVDGLVAAIQDSTSRDQVQALGKALVALAAKLTPAQAEPAVARLIAAIQDSTKSYQFRALGEALAALPVELTPAQAEPAVARLIAAIQDSTKSYQFRALGKALAALTAKLTPAQAETAVASLIAAIQDSTSLVQVRALGEALAALPVELTPAQAETAVDKLVAAIQDSTKRDQVRALGEALAALAAKLTSAQAEPAVDRLVAAIQDSTKRDQVRALGEALVALAAKLTPAQAKPAADRLVAAIQDSTYLVQVWVLGETLAALPVELTPAQAKPAVDRLVAAIQDSTSRGQVELLGKALVALAAKLTPAQAEAAAGRLVAAIQVTTEYHQIWALRKALVALAAKLAPAQAEAAAGRLVAAIQDSADKSQVWALGEVLATLAAKLSHAQAEPAVGRLVAAILDSTQSYQFGALGEALAALPVELTLSQAESAIDGLVAAILDSTQSYQLGALGKALAALAAKLPRAQAEAAADRLVAAIQDSTKSYQLKELGKALAALPVELTPSQAESAIDGLVAAIQDSTQSYQVWALGEALAALAAKLTPAQAEPAASRLVAAIQVTTESDQLRALGEALPVLAAKLSDDQDFAALVFEILKYPNIGEVWERKSAEGKLLDAVRKRFEDKGAPEKDKGFWEMVKWTKKQFPYLDLKSPPKVQEGEKELKKQG